MSIFLIYLLQMALYNLRLKRLKMNCWILIRIFKNYFITPKKIEIFRLSRLNKNKYYIIFNLISQQFTWWGGSRNTPTWTSELQYIFHKHFINIKFIKMLIATPLFSHCKTALCLPFLNFYLRSKFKFFLHWSQHVELYRNYYAILRNCLVLKSF